MGHAFYWNLANNVAFFKPDNSTFQLSMREEEEVARHKLLILPQKSASHCETLTRSLTYSLAVFCKHTSVFICSGVSRQ